MEKVQCLASQAMPATTWWEFCINHQFTPYQSTPIAQLELADAYGVTNKSETDLSKLHCSGCGDYVFYQNGSQS